MVSPSAASTYRLNVVNNVCLAHFSVVFFFFFL